MTPGTGFRLHGWGIHPPRQTMMPRCKRAPAVGFLTVGSAASYHRLFPARNSRAVRICRPFPATLSVPDSVYAAVQFDESDLVTHCLEWRSQVLETAVQFEFGGSIAAAEVGQIGRLLQVQLPVDHSDQHLGNVIDDRRPTRRAHHAEQILLLIEHQGRCHRAAWPLARLHSIGDWYALDVRKEREISQLIVKQETGSHQPAAKTEFDALSKRYGVTLTVDDGDVRCGGQFPGFAWREGCFRALHRVACARLAHTAILTNQPTALI